MSRVLGRFVLNIASAAAMSRGMARRSPTMRMADSLGGAEVTVLGGGFGGLYTALRLSSLDWADSPRPRITLIDRDERFAFSPMLYELATGTASCWEVAPLYSELLADTDIDFVQGEVRRLDQSERVVHVMAAGEGVSERLLPYDHCVVALGNQPRVVGVPGVAEYALPFYTAHDALAVKQRVRELCSRAHGAPVRVGVIGGGYIGVELAANLASAFDAGALTVSLVHRSGVLVPAGTQHSQNEAERQLVEAGVEVLRNTEVVAVGASELQLVPVKPPAATDASSAAYELPVELTLWTGGTQPSAAISALELPLAADGRIDVDETLRVRGQSRFTALGDGAAIVDAAGVRAPSTAQAAMQQADYAAWNVRAAIRDDAAVLPFRYAALGEMLSLGQDAASVSALGQLVKLSGPLASVSRRAVYAARMPTPSQAAKVGISWGAPPQRHYAGAACPRALPPQRPFWRPPLAPPAPPELAVSVLESRAVHSR